MAIERCSENSTLAMSPARISFSYDLVQSDTAPIEHLRSNSSSGVDFNFCTHEIWTPPSSTADELFSDGKIIPTQIRKNIVPPKQNRPPSPDLSPCEDHEQNDRSKDTKGRITESEEKPSSKSFWRFKRSSSLNCSSGYGPSLCPLPLMSRSNSTGSATSQKQNSKKNYPSISASKLSQYSSNSGSYQKPPLKKGYGPYGSDVRVNSVLNVHSANLFGLGSIFGKEKSKRK